MTVSIFINAGDGWLFLPSGLGCWSAGCLSISPFSPGRLLFRYGVRCLHLGCWFGIAKTAVYRSFATGLGEFVTATARSTNILR